MKKTIAILIAIIVILFSVSVDARTLRIGMSGADVFELQTTLVCHGFNPGTPDSIFGKKTKAALIAAQNSFGCTKKDGVYGSESRNKILACIRNGTYTPQTLFSLCDSAVIKLCADTAILMARLVEKNLALDFAKKANTEKDRRADSIRGLLESERKVTQAFRADTANKNKTLATYCSAPILDTAVEKTVALRSLFDTVPNYGWQLSGEASGWHGQTPSGRFTETLMGKGDVLMCRNGLLFGGMVKVLPSYPWMQDDRNQFTAYCFPALNVASMATVGKQWNYGSVTFSMGPSWSWYTRELRGWKNLAVDADIKTILYKNLLLNTNIFLVSGKRNLTRGEIKLTTPWRFDWIGLDGTLSARMVAAHATGTNWSIMSGGEISLNLNKNFSFYTSGTAGKPNWKDFLSTATQWQVGIRGNLAVENRLARKYGSKDLYSF